MPSSISNGFLYTKNREEGLVGILVAYHDYMPTERIHVQISQNRKIRSEDAVIARIATSLGLMEKAGNPRKAKRGTQCLEKKAQREMEVSTHSGKGDVTKFCIQEGTF